MPLLLRLQHHQRSYLYFGQFELEEVGAAGSHKDCREQLGVWFHLHEEKYHKNTTQKEARHEKWQRGSVTCQKRLNDARRNFAT